MEFPRDTIVCITLSFAYIEWVLCSIRNKTCSSCIMLTHHSLNGGVMGWTYRYIYTFLKDGFRLFPGLLLGGLIIRWESSWNFPFDASF